MKLTVGSSYCDSPPGHGYVDLISALLKRRKIIKPNKHLLKITVYNVCFVTTD